MNLSAKTIEKAIDQFEAVIPNILPTKIHLVCDATFFRKRKDKDGLLIFFDAISKQVLWHKFIESETKENYLEGLKYLEEKRFEIQSVTIDGRRGIPVIFGKYPVQICQFHIQKRIRTLLTQNPRSEAGKELKEINSLFVKNRLMEQELGETLALYCRRNYHFLVEKNEEGKYKHTRIIQALKCFKRNIKYIFTFQKYPDLEIPSTSNHVDGGVNTKLKELNRLHKGMRTDRRNKLLVNLLYNLGEK